LRAHPDSPLWAPAKAFVAQVVAAGVLLPCSQLLVGPGEAVATAPLLAVIGMTVARQVPLAVKRLAACLVDSVVPALSVDGDETAKDGRRSLVSKTSKAVATAILSACDSADFPDDDLTVLARHELNVHVRDIFQTYTRLQLDGTHAVLCHEAARAKQWAMFVPLLLHCQATLLGAGKACSAVFPRPHVQLVRYVPLSPRMFAAALWEAGASASPVLGRLYGGLRGGGASFAGLARQAGVGTRKTKFRPIVYTDGVGLVFLRDRPQTAAEAVQAAAHGRARRRGEPPRTKATVSSMENQAAGQGLSLHEHVFMTLVGIDPGVADVITAVSLGPQNVEYADARRVLAYRWERMCAAALDSVASSLAALLARYPNWAAAAAGDGPASASGAGVAAANAAPVGASWKQRQSGGRRPSGASTAAAAAAVAAGVGGAAAPPAGPPPPGPEPASAPPPEPPAVDLPRRSRRQTRRRRSGPTPARAERQRPAREARKAVRGWYACTGASAFKVTTDCAYRVLEAKAGLPPPLASPGVCGAAAGQPTMAQAADGKPPHWEPRRTVAYARVADIDRAIGTMRALPKFSTGAGSRSAPMPPPSGAVFSLSAAAYAEQSGSRMRDRARGAYHKAVARELAAAAAAGGRAPPPAVKTYLQQQLEGTSLKVAGLAAWRDASVAWLARRQSTAYELAFGAAATRVLRCAHVHAERQYARLVVRLAEQLTGGQLRRVVDGGIVVLVWGAAALRGGSTRLKRALAPHVYLLERDEHNSSQACSGCRSQLANAYTTPLSSHNACRMTNPTAFGRVQRDLEATAAAKARPPRRGTPTSRRGAPEAFGHQRLPRDAAAKAVAVGWAEAHRDRLAASATAAVRRLRGRHPAVMWSVKRCIFWGCVLRYVNRDVNAARNIAHGALWELTGVRVAPFKSGDRVAWPPPEWRVGAHAAWDFSSDTLATMPRRSDCGAAGGGFHDGGEGSTGYLVHSPDADNIGDVAGASAVAAIGP